MTTPLGVNRIANSQYYDINNLKVTLSNGKCIDLEKSEFKGNVENTMTYIQDFCKKNDVRIESLGHGYSTLYVNDQQHIINPYGIDLPMMLKFCGKSGNDFLR